VLGQKKTKENLRTRFPADRKPYNSDYDYDADSDLEEDEDCNFSDDEDLRVTSEKGSEKGGNKGSESSTDDNKANRKEIASSDVMSISDMDSLFSEPPGAKPGEAEVVTTPTAAPAHIGTVAVIEDVAFVTYVLFLFSHCRLSNMVQQISRTTPLLIYQRDRICAMGIYRRARDTRSRGNI